MPLDSTQVEELLAFIGTLPAQNPPSSPVTPAVHPSLLPPTTHGSSGSTQPATGTLPFNVAAQAQAAVNTITSAPTASPSPWPSAAQKNTQPHPPHRVAQLRRAQDLPPNRALGTPAVASGSSSSPIPPPPTPPSSTPLPPATPSSIPPPASPTDPASVPLSHAAKVNALQRCTAATGVSASDYIIAEVFPPSLPKAGDPLPAWDLDNLGSTPAESTELKTLVLATLGPTPAQATQRVAATARAVAADHRGGHRDWLAVRFCFCTHPPGPGGREADAMARFDVGAFVRVRERVRLWEAECDAVGFALRSELGEEVATFLRLLALDYPKTAMELALAWPTLTPGLKRQLTFRAAAALILFASDVNAVLDPRPAVGRLTADAKRQRAVLILVAMEQRFAVYHGVLVPLYRCGIVDLWLEPAIDEMKAMRSSVSVVANCVRGDMVPAMALCK